MRDILKITDLETINAGSYPEGYAPVCMTFEEVVCVSESQIEKDRVEAPEGYVLSGWNDEGEPKYITLEEKSSAEANFLEMELETRFKEVRYQYGRIWKGLRDAIERRSREDFQKQLDSVNADIVDLLVLEVCWFGRTEVCKPFMDLWGTQLEVEDRQLLNSLLAERPVTISTDDSITLVASFESKEELMDIMDRLNNSRIGCAEILWARRDRSGYNGVMDIDID